MTKAEIESLIEKAKAAQEFEPNIVLRNSKTLAYQFTALPFNIQTLAQNYLAALELIQDLKSTAETHAMQSYSKTSWKNVEQANAFLKKVGIDASEGNEKK